MHARYGDPPNTPTLPTDAASRRDRPNSPSGPDNGTRPHRRDTCTAESTPVDIDPRWLAGVPRPPDALPDDTGRAYRLPWHRQRDNTPPTEERPEPEQTPQKDTPDRRRQYIDHPAFQDKFGDLPPPDRYGNPIEQADGTRSSCINGRPTRDQIQQGDLLDCGVVATLGAVAEHRPGEIARRITEQPDGTYKVRLNDAQRTEHGATPSGQIIELTVTPEIPIYEHAPNTPSFARTDSDAAWPMIMEKAVAGLDQTWTPQRHAEWANQWESICENDISEDAKNPRTGLPPHGYVRLNQGSTAWDRAELLTQLTGKESIVRQQPDDAKQLLAVLDRQLSDRKPVLIGSRPKAHRNEIMPHKLVASHAYEVIAVRNEKILLRNPWDHGHPEPLSPEEFRANMETAYTTLK